MKRTLKAIFFLTIVLLFNKSIAKDTLIIFNNYKYKVGSKLIFERSGDYYQTPDSYETFSYGLQLISKLGKTKSSIETGLYKITKALTVHEKALVFYNYLSIPINYRFDTKVFYISGGLYFDYLTGKNVRFTNIPLMENYRKFNVGYNIATGVEKIIDEELSLIVEGRLFSNLFANKGGGFVNLGFALGVNYKLLR